MFGVVLVLQRVRQRAHDVELFQCQDAETLDEPGEAVRGAATLAIHVRVQQQRQQVANEVRRVRLDGGYQRWQTVGDRLLHLQSTRRARTRLTALCPGLPGVSRYQNDKTSLDFTGARDSEWQWHQLGHMQVCTSLQTDNHASTPPTTQVFTGRMPFLPPNQQR